MVVIPKPTVDECREFWNPTRSGDKIKAIKHLRQEAGLDLKAAKYLVEEDFNTAVLREYNCEVEGGDSAGYHVDRVFALAAELAYHYAELKKLGVNIGK